MADPLKVNIEPETCPSKTPLLLNPQNQNPEEESNDTSLLDKNLQRLETFLSFFGFHQSCLLSLILSWVAFLIVGVSIPIVILLLIPNCPGCEKYQINNFELDILISQSCLAAISLLCISHNLRKYGIRKFLFVDRYHGHILKFRKEYIHKIEGFFRLLVLWTLPIFILKTLREVIRIIYVEHESWWISISIMLALVFSWTYLTIISLSANILFHLVCNLQVIHFDDYGKQLQSDSDISVFIDEHIRLRYYLSKISHRFRIYLLLEFVVVTASQVVTLFQTTGYPGIITFINGGDFAVSSIVQVVGIIICLHGAAKISHRAQGVGSVASRWHASVTCNSTEGSHLRASNSVGNFEAANPLRSLPSNFRVSNSVGNLEAANSVGSTPLTMRVSNSTGNFEAVNPVRSLPLNFSESDLESLDGLILPSNTRLSSHTASYNKRQAFVLYLQSNPGGFTIFGWTVDRGLINTIFFIEFSLVLFVLGKTVVLTNK